MSTQRKGRGRPKIPDGTRNGQFVRVMGKWIWSPARGARVIRKRGPRKNRNESRLAYALFYMPRVIIAGDEPVTRLVCLNSCADREFITFMQDNYTFLGGEIPTFFPALITPNAKDQQTREARE